MTRSLITGGAGFIGCNLADRLLSDGERATILDDLSRRGSERNLAWLERRHGDRLEVVRADVRDAAAVGRAVAAAGVVYHLAGQTAVTTSLAEPRADFEANALGTLNVLEAARLARTPPVVVYASTNKVYGTLAEVPLVEEATRYRFASLPDGIDERRPLEPDSPYACSKAAGDQYALAYARSYGVPVVVMRQSCIYGPRQLGAEEQGWVAWFAAAALRDRTVSIFGDGKQVRDLLWIDDLIDGYRAAVAHIDRAAGRAYNIGGGPAHTLSVWSELEPLLAEVVGRRPPPPRFAPWRPGDQRVFVSDTRAAAADLGWTPRTGVAEGLERLVAWLADQPRDS